MVLYSHSTSKTEYRIELTIGEQGATLELEDQYCVEQWVGQFDPPYVEKLTAKAGHPLAYPRWLELLSSALSRKDITCYVDVLTGEDLDRLRGKKTQAQETRQQGKRYLILTLMENEQRYHYPLPLKPISPQRSVEYLRRVYEALTSPAAQQQNLSIHSKKSVEVEQYRAQNQILKQKLKRLQLRDAASNLDQEKEKLLRQASAVQEELEKTVQELERREADLAAQLEALRAETSRRRAKLIADDARASKQQAENEKQLAKLKLEVQRNQKQIERIKGEIQTVKKREGEQATRVKQLQAELDAARKQKLGRGAGSYAGSGSMKSQSLGSRSSKSKQSANSKGSLPRKY